MRKTIATTLICTLAVGSVIGITGCSEARVESETVRVLASTTHIENVIETSGEGVTFKTEGNEANTAETTEVKNGETSTAEVVDGADGKETVTNGTTGTEKVTGTTKGTTKAEGSEKSAPGVTQPTTSRVTAKRVTEKATTARKVTQTVTKQTQKATQKATEKATKKPVQQTTKKPTEKATTQAKKGYSYKAYVLNEECLTNSVIAIYIKTDNPNGMWGKKGSVIVETNIDEPGVVGRWSTLTYADVKGTKVESDAVYKVDGGYLYSMSFEKPGTYTVYIKETIGDEYYCYNNLTKVSFKITVKDYKTEEAKWVKNTVKELSPKLKNLSARGKIDYLNNWINTNFKYCLNDGNYNFVYLLSDTIKPYWQSKRGTCINFTNILCMLAKELGYNAKGEAAGYLQHEYAIVYIDGEWVEYPEQPGSEENVFNPKTVKYWDFSQYK